MSHRYAFRRPLSAASRPAQAGFSLVEIMVALVTGLLLSAGVGSIFLSNKQTYMHQDQLSRLQEGGRYALEQLIRDIRMAGSVGCTSRVIAGVDSNMVNTLNGANTLYYNFAVPAEGFEAVGTAPGATYAIPESFPSPTTSATQWTPNLPTVSPAMTGIAIPGADILVLRGRTGEGTPVTSMDLATSPGQFTVAANAFSAGGCTGGKNRIAGVCEGDPAMIADCQKTRIFQVFSAASGGVVTHAATVNGPAGTNACGDWNGAPRSDNARKGCLEYAFPTTAKAASNGVAAEMVGVATTVYFIGRRTPDSPTDNPGPSLYRRISTGSMLREELVEGVESMQVLYGVSTDNTGSVQYVPADGIAGRLVRSIRVGLLLRTLDEISTAADTNTYNVNGTLVNPVDDRRLRRVMTTTIGIRSEFE